MRTEPRMHMISRQSGAVLAIALIFLVVLTLLGITGAQNTVLEERMTGNYRDQQIAFEAAETALRIGENAVLNDTTFDAMAWDGSDGTHEGNPSLNPFKKPPNNSVTVTSTVISSTAISDATSQDPAYYIERLPEVPLPDSSLIPSDTAPKIRYYRVTASGWGQSVNSQVILQSTLYR